MNPYADGVLPLRAARFKVQGSKGGSGIGGRLDKQRVVVFSAGPGAAAAEIPHDRERGAERREYRGTFANPSGGRSLEGIEGAIQPIDEIG